MAISARELTLILRVQSAGTSNIRNLSRDLAALEHGGLSFNERFTRASQALGAFGKQAQLAGGIATAVLGFAANAAANLQSQVTLAATQVGNNVTQVSKVAQKDFQGILNQMTKFPTASSDMAGALYDIYSTLNVTAKQGLPLLNVINKAAVAGGLSARDAGNALLTIMSNFKEIPQTAKGAESAFTRLFAAVRFGRLTMAQLQTALQSTAPAAKIAGQSLDSMAGTVAFLSRSLGPSKAAVGYARLVEVLSGQQMQDGLKKVGVNIDTNTGKMKELNVVIEQLVKRFPYLAQGGVKALNFFKTIGNIQGTIQARRAFATLTKDVGGYQNILSKTVKDNNEFSKSYTVLAKSLGVQWGVLLNTLKSIALQLGLAVIPAFVEMAKPIKSAIEWFQKLDPAVKANIGRLIAFSAVIALVGGTILSLAAGLGVAAASITALGGAAGIFVAGIATYGTLAALGVRIYQNWDALSGLFKNLGKTLLDFFKQFGQAVRAFLQGDWSNMWSHLGDAVKQGASALIQSLNILKVSTLKWVEDFAFTLQGAMTAAIAGMFAMSKFRGRSALAEGVGSKLSTADMLSLVMPMGGVSAITKGASKTDDIAKAVAAMPFLSGKSKVLSTRAILASGDVQAIAQAAPFMKKNERAIADEIVARDKLSKSFSNEVKARAQTMLVQKQMASLQQLENKGLVASSLVRDKQAGIMRTTGGFASSREAQAGMAILNSTPGKVTEVEKATAAAAVGFSRLGGTIGNAGKSLLSFIGFGNVYVGAAVAATAATVILVKAVQSLPNAYTDAMNGAKNLNLGLQQVTTGLRNAAQAQLQVNAAKLTLSQQTAQIDKLKKAVQSATVGTNAYKTAEANLNQAQQNRTQTVLDLKNAQDALNHSLRASIRGSNTALGGIKEFLSNAPQLQQAATTPISAHVRGGTNPFAQMIQSNAATGLKNVNAEAQKAASWLGKATTAFNTFAEAGGKIGSGPGLVLLDKMSNVMSHMLVGTSKLAPSIRQVSTLLGRMVTPAQLQAFGAIPKTIIPGAMRFIQIMHQLPGTATVGFLQAHRNIQQAAGALIATLGHLPNKKQVTWLVNHRQFDAAIASYIRKFHQLPDKKHMEIIIKAEKAKQDLGKAQQKVADLQRNLHQVQARGLGVKTDAFDRNIKKAQQAVQALDKKVTTPHSKNYNIVWHPTVQAAMSTASTLGAQIDQGVAAGITANTVLLNSAMAAAVANAVKAGQKKAQTGSPSKLTKRLIGDPMLQGILAGITDKKSLQAAADTAMTNMIAAFNANKSTFQAQLGDIFTFQAKSGAPSPADIASWGGAVPFSEMKRNLQEQVHTFTRFQQSLRRLNRRRGVNSAFIEMLRQLGPQNQAEIDALLHAPDKAVRQYVKLWERGQKAVSHAAKTATMSQLKEWRQQGAAVALGFMSGLDSHSAQMARYFRNLFLHLFEQVKRVHRSHSPSKLYMEEGMNVAMGFQMGVARGLMRPVGGWGRPLAAPGHGGHTYNTTYHIHQARDESLLGTMRRHDFVTRARR